MGLPERIACWQKAGVPASGHCGCLHHGPMPVAGPSVRLRSGARRSASMRWRRSCRVGATRPPRWTACATSRSATRAPPRASCRCGACCGRTPADALGRGVLHAADRFLNMQRCYVPGRVCCELDTEHMHASQQCVVQGDLCYLEPAAGVAPAVAIHEHTVDGLLMQHVQHASKHAGCPEVCSNYSMHQSRKRANCC